MSSLALEEKCRADGEALASGPTPQAGAFSLRSPASVMRAPAPAISSDGVARRDPNKAVGVYGSHVGGEANTHRPAPDG